MSKPIRMCIHCKGRYCQEELLRLQISQNQIIKHSGIGRSFYICNSCLNDGKVVQSIMKKCKFKKNEYDNVAKSFKEILVDGES